MRYFYHFDTGWHETDHDGYIVAIAALNLAARSGFLHDGWMVVAMNFAARGTPRHATARGGR